MENEIKNIFNECQERVSSHLLHISRLKELLTSSNEEFFNCFFPKIDRFLYFGKNNSFSEKFSQFIVAFLENTLPDINIIILPFMMVKSMITVSIY